MSSDLAERNGDTLSAIFDALALPNVASIDLSRFSAEDVATFIYEVKRQRVEAARRFAAVCAPIDAMLQEAEKRVTQAVKDTGGAMLPHDTLDVKLVPPGTDYDKRIDVLLELAEHVKPDEFSKAVALVGVDVKNKPKAIEAAIAAGGTPIYNAHAGHLNRLKDEKHYGPKSKVGEIIDRGLVSMPKGEPRLVIELNDSAIKAVGK